MNEDVTNFPATGLLEIDNELFSYTGTDAALQLFTAEPRQGRRTTTAIH